MSTAKAKRLKTIYNASKRMGETNDCSVKAVAMSGRVSYAIAHAKCKEHGRKPKRGMSEIHILFVLRSMGFDVTLIRNRNQRQKNGSKFTPKTVGSVCKSGYYVAFTRNHVLPVINGEVYDWTSGRNHHITTIWKITRKRA